MAIISGFSYKIATIVVLRVVNVFLTALESCYSLCTPKYQEILDYCYLRSKLLQLVFSYRLGYKPDKSTDSGIASKKQIKTVLVSPHVELGFKLGIEIHGYEIDTKDGYCIKIFRCSINKDPTKRLPILLVPGLIQSADLFLVGTPQNNLVLYLLQLGYDVWIANNRGTKYSMGHVLIDPNSRRYWQYSLDELSDDFEYFINHILSVKATQKVICIGFANSNIQISLALKRKKYLNQSIALFISLSPIFGAVKQSSTLTSRLVDMAIGYSTYVIGTIGETVKRTLSRKFNAIILGYIVRHFMCSGTSRTSQQIREELYASISTVISTKALGQLHMIMLNEHMRLESSRASQFDFDCPVAVIGGNINTDADSMTKFSGRLKNCVFAELVKGFDSLDLLCGQGASTEVFPSIANLLTAYEFESNREFE